MCNPGELKIHRSKVKFLAFAFVGSRGVQSWGIENSPVKS